MYKFVKYIKVLVFILAIISFIDILINPKGIQYTDSNLNIIPNYFRLFTAFGIIIILSLLTIYELFKNKINKNYHSLLLILRLTFIGLIYFDINHFLKIFYFQQFSEYIITSLHTLPFIFIGKDLIKSIKMKSEYFLFTGLVMIIPTLL